MLSILDESLDECKSKCKEVLSKANEENMNIELDFTKDNLKSIGVNQEIKDIDLTKYKSSNLDKIVDKHFNGFEKKVKDQVLNALNTKDLNEITSLLEKSLKNEDRKQSLVSYCMRAFRTENTKDRSQFKLDLQEELLDQGIKVKRMWVHTLYVSTNVILDEYSPRLDHLMLNGQLEDNGGYFHTEKYDTRGPGLFGVPEEDINCRCDVEYVLDE
jgi:hypothetical protein